LVEKDGAREAQEKPLEQEEKGDRWTAGEETSSSISLKRCYGIGRNGLPSWHWAEGKNEGGKRRGRTSQGRFLQKKGLIRRKEGKRRL